jgi:gamma-glutamyltranspeptidase/glutathione hydrolase
VDPKVRLQESGRQPPPRQGPGRQATAVGLLLVTPLLTLLGLGGGSVRAASPPPMHAAHAAVASDNGEASDVGRAILEAGGNAVDAACGVALALGVVHPHASGIGGGGFALVYLAKEHRVYALDFRERAPAGLKTAAFLEADGQVDPKLSREGGLAVGVPGEVAGLGELVTRFGKLPFARCVSPAEKMARQGFAVSWRLAEALAGEATHGLRNLLVPVGDARPRSGSETAAPGRDQAPREGERVRRPELGATLGRLRQGGPRAFYRGELAGRIVRAIGEAGGVMTVDDLAGYAPTLRAPLETSYRGLRVVSMPPPSSGGVALIEALGILSARYPQSAELVKLGAGSSAYLQVLAETLKHAFADRARFLGDPDFVTVPTARLLSPEYAAALARKIQDRGVLARDAYGAPDAGPTGDVHRDGGTAHLDVVDAEGNAVAMTTTINLGFGSKVVVEDTGIVLNDQMDDFAIQPGVPNGFGLIGSGQNGVAPGKRPLSSMTPTLVLDAQGVRLVAGAAGGPTIITATLQVILNVIDWKMNAQAAVSAPRIHDQWVPELVMVEPEISRDVVDALAARGQKLKELPHIGVANLIVRTPTGWDAAAEPRSPSRPAGY